ncbi:DUF3147 family protein [Kosmotoga pacifica]|uniref:DUF3147 family protein n=1 Tax=Kosmotoga pacifica TaxID=1330330 RepID=A0A0G2ZAP7_9BACT|nr:DUF3147 family protein [Kosmotoga pacifica]AKI96654.1 hypothetical protein IX53_01140 [Kosmotoga pacifica]
MNSVLYSVIKIMITAVLVFLISEVAKRYSLIAGVLASLPLTSILAMIWLYLEKRDTELISTLSRDIFLMVIPSLVFFIAMPIFLRWMKSFYISLLISGTLTSSAYALWFLILKRFGK